LAQPSSARAISSSLLVVFQLRPVAGTFNALSNERVVLGQAEPVAQQRGDQGLHRRSGAVSVEDDVAAGDIGRHVAEPGLLTGGLEVRHRQFARSADIDGAKQSDEDGHG
jgi:hypothetical protein